MADQGLRAKKGGIAAPPFTVGPYTWDQDITFEGRVTEAPGRFTLSEDYAQLPGLNASVGVAFNLNFEILGTNVAEANVQHAATIGAVEMETAGADNDQVIILPHLDASQSAWTGVKWGTENQVIWEAVIRTGAAITAQTLMAGLKLTNVFVIATDDDQVIFRYDAAADTYWNMIYSIGGVDVAVVSDVAVEAATNYYFRIEIDADRKAHFFIDDDEKLVTTALTNDVDLIPYVGIEANAAAAKFLNLVSQKISRVIFE